MKIKAHKIERPFKLSDVAEYFNIPVATLEYQLECLAKTQEIFAHDIKQSGDDYLLSYYAVTLVILNFNFSKDNLILYDSFVQEYSDKEASGQSLAKLYIYGNFLHEKIQTLQLQKETADINRDIEKHNAWLDDMVEYAPPASPAVN